MPVASFDGQDLWECPKRPYCTDPGLWDEVFEAYSWMKRGFLPDQGTWQDQTPAFQMICNVIEAAVAEAEQSRRAEDRATMREH